MGKSKKKTQPGATKSKSLHEWLVDPKNPVYLRRKLLEALESGT